MTPFTKTLTRTVTRGLASLICVAALAACQSAEPNVGVTIADVEQDPEQYFGQTVTVSGEINDVWGPDVFTIGGEGFAGALLIIVPESAQFVGVSEAEPVEEDDIVQITGTVEEYIIAEIESEYGFTPEYDIEYEEREPAVVATTVYLSPRTGGAYGAELAEEEEREQPITDVDEALEAEEEWIGRDVDLTDVAVLDVISDNAFWIGQDMDNRLLVVLDEQATPETAVEGRYNIEPGQTITLFGSLVSLPLSADIRAALNLDEETLSMLDDEDVYLLAQSASGVM